MFASKKILKIFLQLILFSVFSWASHSPAQQEEEKTGQPGPSSSEPADSQDPAVNRHVDRLGEVSTREWEMDLTLPGVTSVLSPDVTKFTLPDADQNGQLQQILSVLAQNPGNSDVQMQLNNLLEDVLRQANVLIDAGSLDEATQLLQLIRAINPDVRGFIAAQNRLQTINDVSELLKAANAALDNERILEPENDNALHYFKLVLSKDPQNQSVQPGLTRVQAALAAKALESARELDYEAAEALLLEASVVREDQSLVEDARGELTKIQQERVLELEQKAIAAMDSGQFTLADFSIIDLIALGGHELKVESLLSRLEEARLYGGFVPGQIIVDELLKTGGTAPQVVVIEAGSFLMGSSGRSEDSHDNEEPRHRVRIVKGFGLGVREVTVDEFRLFIERTGYRTAADLSGSSSVFDEAAGRLNNRKNINWQNDYRGKEASPDMPVLHVNFYDAQAYVKWLAVETGKAYRLPSEAEYEYVARAGLNGTYWWGEGSPSEAVENLTGERDKSPGKREWTTSFENYGDGHWGPAPAGSVGEGELVHPMGVKDIAGNVSEWTEDCWHQNYIKAPVDGSAWVNPGCQRRVRRGGYWASAPVQTRAAFRISAKAESYGPIVGIRIARDL